MKIVRRLGQFVQNIAAGLREPDQRFVADCIRGMVHRGSPMLTEIGRALWERIPLLKYGDGPLAGWRHHPTSTTTTCGRTLWPRWPY